MLVTNEQQLSELLQFIHSNDILAYDIETTGVNPRKHQIIGFGISNRTQGFYVPMAVFANNELLPYGLDSSLAKIALKALLVKKLIMHNAAFDCTFTFNALGVDLLPALHADTMLLKHTCDEEFPFGLKEIATKLFGADSKIEKKEMKASIKANGGSQNEYYKASLETISKYCVQDCLLTQKIYYYYLPKLKKDGLEAFFFDEEVMPTYKEVVIPMKRVGVAVDVKTLQQASIDIKNTLKELQYKIQIAIAPHLDLFTDWFLKKEYPMNGGHIAKLMKEGLSEHHARLVMYSKDYGTEPMFNLLSKHHLKKLFFDTLKETAVSHTEKGNPQVDEEFLELMAKKYTWAADLIVYNKLTKLDGTYIARILEQQENGRFYPVFHMHRTVSGRFSGDIQQLPRPLEHGSAHPDVVHFTNLIREFFVADSDCSLISADYEQLEPTIFAHVSGDPALQQIFNAGTDFYSEVAIRTEHLSGVSSDKTAENYLGKVDKSKRQKAKAYALGIAYGMTGYKLQFEIGVSKDDAEELVQKYLNAFPKLKEWMDDTKEKAFVQGQIRTQGGRLRRLPQIRKIVGQYGPEVGNSLYLWKRYHSNPEVYKAAKQARKIYQNELNNAINVQIQGLGATIMNRAALQLVRFLRSNNLKARLIMQVHDELVLECPNNELEQVQAACADIMQNCYKLSVPLRTVPQVGTNYRQCK